MEDFIELLKEHASNAYNLAEDIDDVMNQVIDLMEENEFPENVIDDHKSTVDVYRNQLLEIEDYLTDIVYELEEFLEL